MKNTLAVIGVSFELPNIKNWKDLKEALSSQHSFVGEMPESRLKEIHDAFGPVQMARVGYLDQIDQFDNEYFGFTERESLRAFPEHRLFLTNAMRAFYHAGYNETSLKGSKTGIFYTATKSEYYNYANVSDLTFNSFDFVKGIEATKLAKFLDLRGPVLSINASCSSSLVAVNVARHSLMADECDIAIVGGVKTSALTHDSSLGNVVHSKSGHCRPFDKDADGMINGEGAVFFVLKKYEKAIEDGDTILAEIRGIGINHGGSQISSLTAPSSNAQKEVMLHAWKDADVTADKVRFIEAHGTGTILGDPIEIEGIKQAIKESGTTTEKQSCALSSFKGQIGHLDYLSGLAGLLRLVAALNFKMIPGQSNFNELNEHFDLKESDLYISRESEGWESNDGVRIGGVSSFGMTGTNVHMVVAKKDHYPTNDLKNKVVNYLQISQKNKEKIIKYKDYLIGKIKELDSAEAINNLCLKLNKVFQVDKENQGIIYTSKDSLISALKSQPVVKKQKIVLLLDLDVCEYSKDFIQSVFTENVLFKNQWNEHVGLSVEKIVDAAVLNILFQFTFYKYLFERLGGQLKFITPKEDTVLNELIKSKINVEQITKEYISSKPKSTFDEKAFKGYLKSNLATQDIVIIDCSINNKKRFDDLGLNLKIIDGKIRDIDRYNLYSLILESDRNPLELGFNPVSNNIDLPFFIPKSFWPTITTSKKNTNETFLEKSDIKNKVIAVWTEVLETDEIKEQDDFFEIGGTSLTGMDMVDELEKVFTGVKIPFDNIYNISTVKKLVEYVFLQLNNSPLESNKESEEIIELDKNEIEQIVRKVWSSILEIDDFKNDEDFFDLGGSSLSALDMIDDLEKSIKGVKLEYEDIYSCSTIGKLVEKISEFISKKEPSGFITNKVINSADRAREYQSLIENLKGQDYFKVVPGNILITGSTGLLGTAMIDYLLNHTKANLFCLVRKKNYESAVERFWSLFGTHFQFIDRSRIRVIEGDLTEVNLGLKGNDKRLPSIDMIFHAGGSPQFMSQKTVENHINFLGTKNLVDWANNNGIKKINLISTIGVIGKVMPPQVECFYETDGNLGQESANLIHGASKLKAEQYIKDHYRYEYKIFRISNIGGRYENGQFLTNLDTNLMWLRLKSLAKLECYSEELLDHSSSVAFIPVDVLVEMVAEIAFRNIEKLNVFHLRKRVSFSNGDVLSALQKAGWHKKKMLQKDFEKYLNDNNQKMNYHKVANKDTRFSLHEEATDVVVAKLNLDKLLEIDTPLYLERLINTNLKLNNIKVAL